MTNTAENDAALIGELRDAADKANMALLAAISSACSGEHRAIQHRDRKPPWCRHCGRDDRGVQHATRAMPREADTQDAHDT